MKYYAINDYASVEKYDSHLHLNSDDDSFIKDAAADLFHLLTINVDVPANFATLEEQQQVAINLSDRFPDWVNFASSFPVKNFAKKGWQEETIARLKDTFSKGAVAVKVWKNIGMELKDDAGNFVMIDHPAFDPVFDFIAANNIPVIGHLGEPKNCWLPVEKMTVQGDVNYFSAHPEYHMYLHPEYPSYDEQINARDRMIEKHPGLQFIGAHFASLEWDVEEVAKRLDKYPNLAVDTAERISHLQLQSIRSHQKVREFLLKYQDRIIYGTDIIVDGSKSPEEMKKHADDIRRRHWRFFNTDELMTVPKVNGEFRGMKLPADVVDKIYSRNAEKWFPGVLKSRQNHLA